MFQAGIYGWVFGIKRGEIEAHKGAHIRIPRFVQFMLKYVVPVYLGAIFVTFCWQNLPGKMASIAKDNVALGSVSFLAVILAFLLVLVHIAGRRWEKEGRFDRLDSDRTDRVVEETQ
jgi:hypothetical protein